MMDIITDITQKTAEAIDSASPRRHFDNLQRASAEYQSDCGRNALTVAYAGQIGADGFARDASQVVAVAKSLMHQAA